MGNVLRILARRGIYLKNTVVVEKLASISAIIFDKTGTLTGKNGQQIQYMGDELTDEDKTNIASLTYHTLHPLGRKIYHELTGYTLMQVSDFRELHGQGIEGYIDGDFIKMGSATYTNASVDGEVQKRISEVHITINGQYKGRYEIRNEYRNGLQALVSRLKTKFDLYVLSGDNDSEKENLKKLIPSDHLLFDQQPADKLQFIKEVQSIKKGTVLMVGDGLNDAGALRQSDVGLVISDDTNNFSPACDGIIDAREFSHINNLVEYATAAMRIVKLSYAISLLYNLAGLYLAVRGTMSPIMAAVLMPVSSATIITFSTLSSWLAARKHDFA
jgi:Cu+-exporting ATPase